MGAGLLAVNIGKSLIESAHEQVLDELGQHVSHAREAKAGVQLAPGDELAARRVGDDDQADNLPGGDVA